MTPRSTLRLLALLTLLVPALSGSPWEGVRASQHDPLVFAASSTTEALQDLAAAFAAKGGGAVRPSFAASSVLAKQIEAGAPAQVFLSADVPWMDYLDERGLLEPGSRVDLLGNRLVLVAPKDHPFQARMEKGFDLAAAFKGRFAVGDPQHVPAGIYARQALVHLGWWDALKPRLAPAENVRAALRLVEMGEAGAGAVYASDALASTKVAVAGVFPDDSHDPIVYPAALCKGASARARAFLAFLASPEARPVWEKHGFAVLK